MNREELEKLVDELTKKAAAKGKLIEIGWQSYRLVLPPNLDDVQLADLRTTFFAGCAHLFGSIMTMLDPGTQETDGDVRKFNLINDELHEFMEEFQFTNRHRRTKR